MLNDDNIILDYNSTNNVVKEYIFIINNFDYANKNIDIQEYFYDYDNQIKYDPAYIDILDIIKDNLKNEQIQNKIANKPIIHFYIDPQNPKYYYELLYKENNENEYYLFINNFTDDLLKISNTYVTINEAIKKYIGEAIINLFNILIEYIKTNSNNTNIPKKLYIHLKFNQFTYYDNEVIRYIKEEIIQPYINKIK